MVRIISDEQGRSERSFELPMRISDSSGHCWVIALPPEIPAGDVPNALYSSTLRLFEDDVELGPPHCAHADIRQHGLGRYSHWRESLFFSTSDNSDPRRNGRRYRISIGGDFRIDAEVLEAKVANELALARTTRATLERFGIPVAGLVMLEIGPGEALGASILLAGLEIDVIVADPYVSGWKPLHSLLYRRLAEEWEGGVEPLQRAIAAESLSGVLTVLTEPADDLRSLQNGRVDVVVSSSVLEHIPDIESTARELARVSRPGALHCHSIDFRDHHDLSRPLEHLFIEPAQFRREQEANCWVRGCQLRLREVVAIFAATGFEIVEVNVSQRACADYVAAVLDRLRAAQSPFSRLASEELSPLVVQVIARAPGAAPGKHSIPDSSGRLLNT